MMTREDFPTMSDYARYILSENGKKATVQAVQRVTTRYNKGVRDIEALVAPPMTRQQAARKNSKNSAFSKFMLTKAPL